ncbi:INO80 complex subunit D [Bicyclus anynana]|uniref:INO80 complex subunit D n=1 Tax=Bicyclus anynana TaxID=110368 RepID=A0ABM3LY60_BICAN|nr:INO80 complex subunit D [Bicyclus anynana]
MSYLSASENVGFSGITQNISDGSCATQYKMAVESVSGGCGSEVMYIHDSDSEQYIPHISDNFFHTKFKIDPNELYTFHDSDVIANEITVSHTEDNFVFDNSVDIKPNHVESLKVSESIITPHLTNGIIKQDKEILNGHFSPVLKTATPNHVETKIVNAKVPKAKTQVKPKLAEVRSASVSSSSNQNLQNPSSSSTNVPSSNTSNNTASEKTSGKKSNSETFLDVFKREQGVIENTVTIKTEPNFTPLNPTLKLPTVKKPAAAKTSQPKPRKGRGPTVHEALQRIPHQPRALALPNVTWHAPGEELFQCGPLEDKRPNAFRQLESSSSDDDNVPEIDLGVGTICVEESAAESRGARLALRRAAMRRQVVRAATSLQLAKDHREHRALASLIKKQLSGQSSKSCRIPPQTMNHLLAMRGMSTVLSLQERRKLRQSGWSGSESVRAETAACAEERCSASPLPCARHCLAHATLAPEQRLYAACAAVFAGGERCKQPLLPLQEQTPLCAEHAWKRDNYELLSRESKPAKAVRKRAWVPAVRAPRAPRAPRRAKRRRRLVPKRPPNHTQSLSEINVCSNSSAYDSSEDTAMGGLSENEYMTVTNSHVLEVGQVPPDDILDPSVLNQIPDEAFTEFFNQAESGSTFGEGLELAAALEAVLDERALDMVDVFQPAHGQKNKMQVPAAVTMEISSSAPS